MSAGPLRHDPPGAPVLDVAGLTTEFTTRSGVFRAVDDLSFAVDPGECLGIVGESGSGKSVAVLSVMGLVSYPGRIAAGRIGFEGRELRGLPEADFRALRGARMSIIFQDPQTSLNPLFTVGKQMTDVVHAHRDCGREEARALAIEKLTQVGVSSPEQRLRAYPWELSGGLRQRVAIAMALLLDPRLVIADEPTTALDVSIQSQIIDLLMELKDRLRFAMIFVSHDLGVIANVADRMLVMYAGRAVEMGDARKVLARPTHPYTAALIASAPTLKSDPARPLQSIEGSLPGPGQIPQGCVFAPRCGQVRPSCREAQPPLAPQGPEPGRRTACFFPIEAAGAGAYADE
ncbi:MAG: ABC transporter ATP-binding protein [Chloroflexota bacterium]